jgi:hypothetical protein
VLKPAIVASVVVFHLQSQLLRRMRQKDLETSLGNKVPPKKVKEREKRKEGREGRKG